MKIRRASPVGEMIQEDLTGLDLRDPQYASEAVRRILAFASRQGASDLHFQPTASGLALKIRLDGVLQPAGLFPQAVAPNLVARLKVLAELLTYRTDVPQEGRIRVPDGDVEMRVSTFPTLYGERAVVRLFGGNPTLPAARRSRSARRRAGALAAAAGRDLRRDPGLRAGRQRQDHHGLRLPPRIGLSGGDPEPGLARGPDRSGGRRRGPVAGQPAGRAGPGHRSAVPHAAGPGGDPGRRDPRSGDRRSGLPGVADRAPPLEHLPRGQRGGGRRAGFSTWASSPTCSAAACWRSSAASGPPALFVQPRRTTTRPPGWAWTSTRLRLPVGCPACGGTGYRGRFVLVEMLTPQRNELGQAILSRSDSSTLEQLAVKAGMVTRWQRACKAIDAGLTSAAEVRRVLGFSDTSPSPSRRG